MGQEAHTQTDRDHSDEGPGVAGSDVIDVAELVGIDEKGPGPDGDDASGQAVQAIYEVDRIGHDRHPEDRGQGGEVGAQDHRRLRQRDMEEEHVDAEEVEHRTRQYLAGELGRRRHLAQVVRKADREDHRRGQHDAQRGGAASEDRREGVQLRCDRHGHQ